MDWQRQAASGGRNPEEICVPGESPAPRGERRPWLRRVLTDFWPFFVVPVVLTGLFAGYWTSNWKFLALALLANTMISICIGGTIYGSYALFGGRLLRRVGHSWLRYMINAVILVGGVVVGAELAVRALGLLSGLANFNISRGDMIRVGLVVAAVIWTVEATIYRLRERARQIELREEQTRRTALRAQFEALQARTNPHFLYNSLNTVAGLIEENPVLAERMLERLSDLFRYALEGSRRAQVTLDEELNAVRGYLEVEGMRFGERLRYSVDAESGTGALPVPPLVLQPLVENAVLHGVAPRPDGGRVEVRAERRNGSLRLTVADDGPGPGGSSHQGTRTALRDLAERLDLLYGDRAGLDHESAAGGGYRVTVRLPLAAGER